MHIAFLFPVLFIISIYYTEFLSNFYALAFVSEFAYIMKNIIQSPINQAQFYHIKYLVASKVVGTIYSVFIIGFTLFKSLIKFHRGC